jgi:glycosyltransferase involved in cell wall biosynthesis
LNGLQPLISVVIPVLDEESLLNELIKRVKENLEVITKNFEVIIIDDGSLDMTWQLIKEESLIDTRIKGIKFSRNFGHHYAITAGIKKSIGEWVVVMDGDLQDRPEVIVELFNEAQKGFDIVFVSRLNRPESLAYRLTQKSYYFLLRKLSGIDFDSGQANFSIISRKVVEAFNSFPENARFYGSTIKWVGFKRSQIFADHGKRLSGKSSYNFGKRLRLALDIILSFSDRPLKLAIYLGALISGSSIIFSLYILSRSVLWGYRVEGWASIIIFISFLCGIILSVLGIIGVYIGRIFREVKARPLYITSESTNFD